MSLNVKKFSVELPTNGGTSWALIGSSRSGKTTLLKHLYKNYFSDMITVMCSMNPHADIYKDLSKKVLVTNVYDSQILEDMHKINAHHDNKFPFLFISDDYVDNKIKNDRTITKCLTIFRNANLHSVFSFQGNTLMSSVGRNSTNYVCIFKQQTPKAWKNCIEEFLSMHLPLGMSMPEMIKFCMEATENHQFFMIDNILGECYLTKLSKGQL